MVLIDRVANRFLSHLRCVLEVEGAVINLDGRVVAATNWEHVGASGALSVDSVSRKSRALAIYTPDENIGSVRLPLDWDSRKLGELVLFGTNDMSTGRIATVNTIFSLVMEAGLGEGAGAVYKGQSPTVRPVQSVPSYPTGLDIDAEVVVVVFEIFSEKNADPLSPNNVAAVLDDFKVTNGVLSAELVSERLAVALLRVEQDSHGWNRQRTIERIKNLCLRLDRHPWLAYFCACGHFYPGQDHIAESYQSALATLSVGKRVKTAQKFYMYDELSLEVLLHSASNSWAADHIASQYRTLSSKDKNGCLKKTLDALFNTNMNQGEAARKLHIHRNTLRYRIDKIGEYTGMDMNDIGNVFLLYSSHKLDCMGLS